MGGFGYRYRQVQLQEPKGRPIDYAPPPHRTARLWARLILLILLVLSAGVSALVVVPRVWQRAELLRLQRTLAEPAGSRVTFDRRAGVTADDPGLARRYREAAFGPQPRTAGVVTLFSGSVSPAAGGPERLLFVDLIATVIMHGPEVFYLRWEVVEPTSWFGRPLSLASGGRSIELPFSPEPRELVIRGSRTQGSGATVQISLEASWDIIDEWGGGPESMRQSSRILLHLMPNDTIRIDPPSAPEVIRPTN